MTTILYGARRSGKTHRMIEMANRDGGYIVVRSRAEAYRISQLGVDRFPMVWSEFAAGRYSRRIPAFHIDGLESWLAHLTPVPIQTISFDQVPRLVHFDKPWPHTED